MEPHENVLTIHFEGGTADIGAKARKLAQTPGPISLFLVDYLYPSAHADLLRPLWDHPSVTVSILIDLVLKESVSSLARFLVECPAPVKLMFSDLYAPPKFPAEDWAALCQWIAESKTLETFVWERSFVPPRHAAELCLALAELRLALDRNTSVTRLEIDDKSWIPAQQSVD